MNDKHNAAGGTHGEASLQRPCLAVRMLDTLQTFMARMEHNVYVRGAIFALLLAIIGGTMLLLNMHTPLLLDDYDFMISWATGEKLTGLADVVRSQMVHYNLWGGRLVQSFTQASLYWGKGVFNLINTIMYLVLLLEIYAIARPKRRFCWTLLLLEHLVMMTMVPFFGTVYLWLCGSCNYLWGTALALIPILVLRSVMENGWFAQNRMMGVLCLPLGILGGWSNENTTLGVIALVFAALLLAWISGKQVKKRLYLLLAGQCVGAMILLLAPGNFARASAYSYDSMILELLRRFVMVTAYAMSYLGLLLAAAILLGALLRGKGGRGAYAAVLIFGALIASYALVGSPELSDRSFTAPIALTLAGLLVLAGDAEERGRGLDAAKLCALPLVMVFMLYTSYHALSDVKAHEQAWGEQIAAIEQAVEKGLESVNVESVSSHSRFTMDVALAQDAGTWPNTSISKIYGINVNSR